MQSFVFLSAPANNTPFTLGQVPETLPQHSASNSLRLPAWRCFLPGPQSTWPQKFQSTISICNIYIYTQYSTGPPPRQRTNSPGRATRHTLPRRTNARRRGSAGGGPGDTSTGLVLSFSRSLSHYSPRIRPSCIKRGQIPRMQRISFSRSQRSGCSTGHDTSIHTQVVCK